MHRFLRRGVRAMEDLLRDPMLLEKLIEDIQQSSCLVGNRDAILAVVIKSLLRLVQGAKPTSSNLVVSSDTGSGKDYLVKSVLDVIVPSPVTIHITGISKKAPNYLGDTYPDLDPYVLYLEDPDNDTLESQGFRTLASGGNRVFIVEGDGKKKLYNKGIKGKPVMIVTTMKSTIDKEGDRRWDTIRVDRSEETTERVLMTKAKISSNEKPESQYKAVMGLLKRSEVIIPFAEAIVEAMDKDVKTNLLMRTKIDSLFDYIRTSAVLHQYQRKNDNGKIVAELDDYKIAKQVFDNFKQIPSNLTEDEQSYVDYLNNNGGWVSIHEWHDQVKIHTPKWIYERLDRWAAKGLIETKNEFNEKANKPIMMVSFIGNLIGKLPNPEVLTGFIEVGKNQNREGYSGYIGISKIIKNNIIPPVPQPSLLRDSEKSDDLPVSTGLRPRKYQEKPDENLEIVRQCEERMKPAREYSSKQVCYDLGFMDKELYPEDLEDALDDVTMRPNNPTKVRKLGDDRYCLYTQ